MNHRDLASYCLRAYDEHHNLLSAGECDVLMVVDGDARTITLAVRGTEASESPFGVIKRGLGDPGELVKLFYPSTWSNGRDIVRDLMFWGKRRAWGSVHYGAWKSASEWLHKHLHRIRLYVAAGWRIILTGHSLGAMVAVNMALELKHLLPDAVIDRLVVFGEPASLNRAAAVHLATIVPARTSYCNTGPDGRMDWITRAYTGLASWCCTSRTLLHGEYADNYHDMELYAQRVVA